MIKEVNFKATTRTVNLLGKDNVLDYRSAILELVKNGYDAFSKRIDIIINKDILEIIDYGNGMNLEKIDEVFFTIGTDDKTNTPSIEIDSEKRIMNGSMGIGRLSLGRLGKKSTIITSDGKKAYEFTIDWTVFSTGNELSEIKVPIFELSLEKFENEYKSRGLENPNKCGTIIKATNLHDNWQKTESNTKKDNLDSLKQSLKKLKNPMKLNEIKEFSIYLKYFDNELEELEYSVDDIDTDAIIDFSYSYEDDLLIMEGKFPEIDLNFFPPDFIYSKFELLKPYIIKDGRRVDEISFYKEFKISEFISSIPPKNPIGNFDGTIYFTKNTSGRRYPFIKESAIKNFNFEYEPGISLYRDGFRIRPYGEKDLIGFDWIGIESERSRNPAGVARKTYIMQANQLSGFINITKENNDVFEDQANREGLKKSPEFIYLREILLEIIKEFSRVRSNIHIWYNEYLKENSDIEYHSDKGKNVKRKIDRLLQKNQGNQKQLFDDPEYEKIVTPETILELYALSDTTLEKNDSLISETDMLRILATQGIIMSTFAHQIKNDRLFFRNSSKILKKMGNFYRDDFGVDFDKIKSDLNIFDFSESVERKNNSVLSFIESAIKKPKKAKKKSIQIVPYIIQIFEWWSNSIRDNYNEYTYVINNETDFSKLSPELNKFFVYGDEQQLDCIFLNLLSNTHKSFEKGKINKRKIDVNLSLETADKIKIIYKDNGIGLDEKIKNKKDIFEPYKSYEGGNQGTGMGMWILSSIVESLNGKKQIVSDVGNPGFEIEVTLLGGIIDELKNN